MTVVRDVVEEPLDVGVEYVGVPLPMEFQHPLHGLMTVACRPEAIGVVVKDPLEERTQEEPKHLLSNAVADGGDTQRAGLARRPLGMWTRRKGRGWNVPLLRSRIRASKFCSRLASNMVNADLVDPRRAPVPFDVPEGGDASGPG